MRALSTEVQQDWRSEHFGSSREGENKHRFWGVRETWVMAT